VTAAAARRQGERPLPERLWISTLARAVPALAVSLAITFSSGHTAAFGLAAFGILGLASGLLTSLEAIVFRDHPARALTLLRGAVSVVAGVVSLLFILLPRDEGAADFTIVLASWAFATGALELGGAFAARRAGAGRPAEGYGRAGFVTGGLTILLGLVVALVPADLNQSFGSPDTVQGVLTASIQTIGFLGAYLALVGVFLVIEAVSLRGIARADAASGGSDAADTGAGAALADSADPREDIPSKE